MTTLDLQSPLRAFLDSLPADARQPAVRFASEYREHRDVFERQGVTESAYIRSRLVDGGLAHLVGPSDQTPHRQPSHERLPGLVSVAPTGDQVGCRD